MAARKVPNHQKVGTLVAPLAKEAPVPSAAPTDALSPLMKLVHEQITKGLRQEPGSDSGFAVWDAPLMGCHLQAEGHFCVAQLRCNSVCVIKMRDDGCWFFVRMKRGHWEDGLKAKRWTAKTAPCALYRDLTREEGVSMLLGARPFQARAGHAYHPYALSVLCGMARNDWLNPGAVAESPRTDSGYRFGLVLLPPSPMVLEACFCLLGHKETFVESSDSDSEDEDIIVGGKRKPKTAAKGPTAKRASTKSEESQKPSAPATPAESDSDDSDDNESERASGDSKSESDSDGTEDAPTPKDAPKPKPSTAKPKPKDATKSKAPAPAKDAPKKPKAPRKTSAWDMYRKSKNEHARAAAAAAGKTYSFADSNETAKKAAERWRGLPEVRKVVYKERAAEENSSKGL